MGAGIDVSSVDPLMVDRILTGLIGENESMVERVFGRREVNRTEGKIGYRPSRETVARSNSKGRVALGAPSNTMDGSYNQASFSFDFKYAEKYKAHKLTVESIADQTADDVVTDMVEGAVIQVCGLMDIDGAQYLSNTAIGGVTINDSVEATDVWSNPTNARPMTDLDALFDLIGAADILWLGLDRARELAALPAIKEQFANFNGVDGRLSMSGLANALLDHYSFLDEVIIDDAQWKNTANEQQAGSFARIFDGVVWAGKREHYLIVEYAGSRKARSWFDEETDNYYGEAVRYIDFARAETKMGAILTST